MTRWGLILLIAFLVFGLRSSIDEHRARRCTIWLTAVVLAFIFVKGHAL
jgi:hypothetical protein